MDVSRKEFIAGLAGAMAVAGCKHVPSPDSVNLAAKAIGGATGLVLNECDIPDEARSAIVEITREVIPWIPEIGQPLETAWSEKAQALVDKMIADGRLDAAYGPVVMAAFKLVVRGFALLEQKYPGVRTSRELLGAAASGFGEGLLDVMAPANGPLSSVPVDVTAVSALRRTPEYRAAKGVTFLRRNGKGPWGRK